MPLPSPNWYLSDLLIYLPSLFFYYSLLYSVLVSHAQLFVTPCMGMGFPGGLDSKESACSVGDVGLISGLRRSPGEGNGYPLQYSGLENFMDCIVHGVAKS